MTARYSGSRTHRAAAFLAVLAAATALVSIAVRLLAAGWMIVIYAIPLLVVAIIHMIVHVRAATRLAARPGLPPRLFVLSDMLCLLGFALQPDFDDAGFYFGLYMVWNLVAHGGELHNTNSIDWYLVAFYASLACLLGLVATWIIIWLRSLLPKTEVTTESIPS